MEGLQADVEQYCNSNLLSDEQEASRDKIFSGNLCMLHGAFVTPFVLVAALKNGDIDVLGLCQLLGGALQGTDERIRKRGSRVTSLHLT